ncbi:hypothetical protein [Sunxiuqinia indica]|uniref:hypothetical protein n=1 Tax=Sunxiuqinia indica TaxID=2692584 RepID=UPI00135C793A|nr:hypothetical protein [Sunxiuqinia indica]
MKKAILALIVMITVCACSTELVPIEEEQQVDMQFHQLNDIPEWVLNDENISDEGLELIKVLSSKCRIIYFKKGEEPDSFYVNNLTNDRIKNVDDISSEIISLLESINITDEISEMKAIDLSIPRLKSSQTEGDNDTPTYKIIEDIPIATFSSTLSGNPTSRLYSSIGYMYKPVSDIIDEVLSISSELKDISWNSIDQYIFSWKDNQSHAWKADDITIDYRVRGSIILGISVGGVTLGVESSKVDKTGSELIP